MDVKRKSGRLVKPKIDGKPTITPNKHGRELRAGPTLLQNIPLNGSRDKELQANEKPKYFYAKLHNLCTDGEAGDREIPKKDEKINQEDHRQAANIAALISRAGKSPQRRKIEIKKSKT